VRKVLIIFLCLLLILGLALPGAAAADTPYVIDDAALLTPEQRQELNARAEQIADTYGIGVYVMTVSDYRAYGDGTMIFDVLSEYYHANRLGCGKDRQGLILMISMDQRDWATFYYGEDTEYAFNSFGQKQHEGYFLDDLQQDDWYGGFSDHLTAAEEFLAKAAAGDPVRDEPWSLSLLFVLIALFVSFLVTRLLWMRMSNVAARKDADAYGTSEGLVLTEQSDLFTHQTVKRVKVESSSASGSSQAHSGGGGSGRSGKF